MQIIVTVLLRLPLGVMQAGSASGTGMLLLLERAKSGPRRAACETAGCADLVLRDAEPNYVFGGGRCRKSQRVAQGLAGQNMVHAYHGPWCAGGRCSL